MLGLGLTVSCEVEKPETLSEIQIPESYVSIDVNGGSTQVQFTASDAWQIDAESLGGWITAAPTSGSAGSASVKLTAEATKATRSAEVKIVCGGKTQYVNVIQYAAKVDPPMSTAAQIIAGADGNTYRIKGICSRYDSGNANAVLYGNWYITDETGTVYIYGTLDKKGQTKGNPLTAWDISVGDEVTIEGPKSTYNGTVELVDVTVLKVVKSLVKIESGAENALDANGGDFDVKLTCKGDGPAISIPDDAKAWLGVSGIKMVKDTTVVSFHVAENTQESSRSAEVKFTSASGSTSSTVSASVSQTGLIGTATNPFTVAQAIEFCQTLTGATPNDFYVKGKISRIIANGEFGSYGNATFYISDDGEYKGTDDKTCDVAHDFEAYRILYFGNKKWESGQANIAVGDEVVICGQLTLYKGISETNQNKAYLYQVNGVLNGDNGLGNAVSPFNMAGARACIDAAYTGNVYVGGIISRIVNNGAFGAQYGNATFWMSDDGTFKGTDDKTGDASHDFEAYRVLYLGNRKWVEGDTQIAVGDKVVLCGALTKYGSTYETSSGKAWIYSLNGKTE